MMKLIALIAVAMLISSSFVAVLRADDTAPATKVVQGELLDMYCYSAAGATGRDHGKTCGKDCLASGIPGGILVNGKAWLLATNPRPLADYVGLQIRVTGVVVASDTTILPDKVEVKEGDNWTEVKLSDEHHK